MAKAVCCDRCGKFEKFNLRPFSERASEWVLLRQSDLVMDNGPEQTRWTSFNLCPDCAAAFKAFMEKV